MKFQLQHRQKLISQLTPTQAELEALSLTPAELADGYEVIGFDGDNEFRFVVNGDKATWIH